MTVPRENNFLYDFPLTQKSVCIDVGGYEGEWSAEIARRYGCKVFAFEPIPAFHEQCARNLEPYPTVHLYQAGVGGRQRLGQFHVHGNMTGEFDGGAEVHQCRVISIREVLDWCERDCSLIKLNCEGGEFEILESLLQNGWMGEINYLAVQFHGVVERAEERYYAIRRGLALTHKLLNDQDWVWQVWGRK